MAAKKARMAVSAKVAAMSLKAKMAAGVAPTTAAVAAPKAARVDALIRQVQRLLILRWLTKRPLRCEAGSFRGDFSEQLKRTSSVGVQLVVRMRKAKTTIQKGARSFGIHAGCSASRACAAASTRLVCPVVVDEIVPFKNSGSASWECRSPE